MSDSYSKDKKSKSKQSQHFQNTASILIYTWQLNCSITDIIKDINSCEISVILKEKRLHSVASTQCRTKLFLGTQELI